MTSRFDPKRKNGMSSQLSGLVPTPRTHRFRSGIFEAGECLQNCSLSHTTRDEANLGTCSAWVCESTKTEMYALKSLFFSSHVFHLLANRPRHWCTVAGGPLARTVRRVDAAVFRCIKDEHLLWAFSLHRCWLEVTRSRLYSSGSSSNKPRVCVFFGGTLFDGRLRRETRSSLRDPCLR